MGDGEQQEGSIWEAVMEGSHYKLDNLVGIIDRNRLQIDGWVKDVMNVEPLEERYRSVRLGGHRGRRSRHAASGRCVAEGEEHSDSRQADDAHREHGEGQGRQLHGERCGMARQGAELRRDGEGAGRTGAEADHRLRRAAEEGGGVSEGSGGEAGREDAALLAGLLVERGRHMPR